MFDIPTRHSSYSPIIPDEPFVWEQVGSLVIPFGSLTSLLDQLISVVYVLSFSLGTGKPSLWGVQPEKCRDNIS